MTCTCSSAMCNGGNGGGLFGETVTKAMGNAGRTGRIVKKVHTAECHVGLEEYLTAITVVVDAIEEEEGSTRSIVCY